MAIQKVIDPDSATADRPKQVTGHTVDGRVGQDVYVMGEKTPLTGFATAVNQRIVANTTEYTQAALVDNVLTIASSKGLYLKNDGTSDYTITIGSLTFTVKPGEVRCIETAAAFTTVTFSAGAIFRAFGITRSA